MTVRDVPRAEWTSFLERFTREHRAWRATIHGIEHDLPVTVVPSGALRSVSLETHAADPVVRLTFSNGVSLCAPRPCGIRVHETERHAACALEVETVDGAFIRLAFRAVALPEQLDGIAPNELADEPLIAR